ncbi:MAG: biotin-dependent carboxyltransferase family protein [Cyclobacteriaceae bacterium]|nr:biotin-dependent carboxyltransferase family protein [Cyclobacteriaceae bacterium]
MSIEVIKAGMGDSVQDQGRFGVQHLGINPNGVMDQNAMMIANALVGNELKDAVLEMSFPAPTFCFTRPALIALSGADFTAKLNGKSIPLNQPVRVASGSELKFTKVVDGVWCYLAVRGGFEIHDWLGSKSTNTKANVGGLDGRFLKKGDRLDLKVSMEVAETKVFPWRANVSEFYTPRSSSTQTMIRCIQGNEFDWLTKKSKQDFLKKEFTISRQSDRMGYRLAGTSLKQSQKQELLSTAVSFGTIQVLPNGEPIALMADHQTTGGYPRIAHVIGADRSRLVQGRPNERISFSFVSIQEAEDLLMIQERSLRQLQKACKFKLQEIDYDD